MNRLVVVRLFSGVCRELVVVLALTFGGRARDTHNAVRHVQLFNGKRPSPHACPRMRAGKGRAGSKQTRQTSSTTTLSANKQAPLEASSRRRHMAASARMNL